MFDERLIAAIEFLAKHNATVRFDEGVFITKSVTIRYAKAKEIVKLEKVWSKKEADSSRISTPMNTFLAACEQLIRHEETENDRPETSNC